MITIIRYKCEICGTEYECKELAELCESYVLPPCPVKIGDAVEAYQRYGKPELDEVIAVSVGSGNYLYASYSEEEWNKSNSKKNLATHPIHFHQWYVQTRNRHMVSKDGDYDDKFTLAAVKLPGADVWLDGDRV